MNRDFPSTPGGVQIERPGVLGYQPEHTQKRPRRRPRRQMAFSGQLARQRAIQAENDGEGYRFKPSSGEQGR